MGLFLNCGLTGRQIDVKKENLFVFIVFNTLAYFLQIFAFIQLITQILKDKV